MTLVVAVTCDRRDARPPSAPASPSSRVRPSRPEVFVVEHVVLALRAVGLEPLLIPPHDGDPSALVDWLLAHVDGVVLTGGPVDLHPSLYGEAVAARLDRVDPGRAGLELALAKRCIDEDRPLLGLCGGMQTLAVAAGGTLIQDIATQHPGLVDHEQATDPTQPWHDVHLEAGRLRTAYGRATIGVNSTHHQAVRNAGLLSVVGRAPDGIVEAIEHPERAFCVGVQWHPELIDQAPFTALAASLGSGRPKATRD